MSRGAAPEPTFRIDVANVETDVDEDTVGKVWSDTRLKRRVHRTVISVATFPGESIRALRTGRIVG